MFHLLLTERSVESNWSLKDRVNIVIMGFHELCRIRGTLVRHNPTEEDQAAALEAERALDAAELAEMCGPESKREECLKRFWAFKKEIGKRDPETAPEEA